MHTPRLHKEEAGFGLIELLIAMVVLNVGLLALVAAFSSGGIAIKRAGKVATASTLADAQMEQYRSLLYEAIGLDVGAALDAVYTGDAACSTGTYTCGNQMPKTTTSANSCATGSTLRITFPNACLPTRSITGSASPDGKSYRIDTYVRLIAATSTQRATKLVTVVVRDGTNVTGRPLARAASSFDCSTGKDPNVAPTATC